MQKWSLGAWEWGEASQLVILTGAGISAESGVKTFRDHNGLWENHRIEDVASPEGFQRDPALVLNFYEQRRLQLSTVLPNDAHRAIAALQNKLGDRCYLVTQNVDDLHERGGSSQVCHMHGELLKAKCVRPKGHVKSFDLNDEKGFSVNDSCQYCGAAMRPDIVWFGEIPYHMDAIMNRLSLASHFVFIGTSSLVYPAAGFKQIVSRNLNEGKVLCINLEVDFSDPFTHYYLEGKATEMVPRFINEFI